MENGTQLREMYGAKRCISRLVYAQDYATRTGVTDGGDDLF